MAYINNIYNAIICLHIKSSYSAVLLDVGLKQAIEQLKYMNRSTLRETPKFRFPFGVKIPFRWLFTPNRLDTSEGSDLRSPTACANSPNNNTF